MNVKEKIEKLISLGTRNNQQNEMEQAIKKAHELAEKYGFVIVNGMVMPKTNQPGDRAFHFTSDTEVYSWYQFNDIDSYWFKLLSMILVELNIEHRKSADGRKIIGMVVLCTKNTFKALTSLIIELKKEEGAYYTKCSKEGTSKGFRERFSNEFERGIHGRVFTYVENLGFYAVKKIKTSLIN